MALNVCDGLLPVQSTISTVPSKGLFSGTALETTLTENVVLSHIREYESTSSAGVFVTLSAPQIH